MDLNITILDILVIWLGNRLLDHALKLLTPPKKKETVSLGGEAAVSQTKSPPHWLKTCQNCQRDSFTMYLENKCPYCDRDRVATTEANLIQENRAMDALCSSTTIPPKWTSYCPACRRTSYTMYSEKRCPYCAYDGRKLFDPKRNMCSAMTPPRNVCDYPKEEIVHPL